jgi:hypothetical protein
MRFDRKRWEAAFAAWRMRRWFERAINRSGDGSNDPSRDEAPREGFKPNPEPTLHFLVCRGCRVEYIPTTIAMGYTWEPDSPWLLCDACEAARRRRPGRARSAARARHRKASSKAERRAEALKRQAIRKLAGVLARIASRRAGHPSRNN